MYYKLRKDFLLRGWEKLPYAVVDSKNGNPIFITKPEMEALSLCNGCIDVSMPIISETIQKMLPVIEKNGFIVPCEAGDRIDKNQEYRLYPARYIKTAHWSITGKCNYRCKHCYMSAPDAKLGELSHDEIFSIIDQLEECGIFHVTITGGEPLVRQDFMEIVDALIAKNIHIQTIYSNGFLVTDHLLDELDKRGIHPEFNMSFDGIGHHDWLRGIPGAEKYARDAFLRCREKGFPTGAEMCIFNDNKDTLRDTVKLLGSWGCGSLKTNPISNVGAWKEGGYGESIPLDDLYQLYLDYIPEFYEDGMPLSLQLGGFFMASPWEPEKYYIPSRKHCENPDTMCMCGHARQVMYISAEGRALPCMSLSGMDIQKNYPLIPDIGLKQCLTDSTYMSLIDTRATAFFELNPGCKDCKYAMECVGGCRASALETSPDNIMAPDLAACKIFKDGWIPKIEAAAEAGIRIMKEKSKSKI